MTDCQLGEGRESKGPRVRGDERSGWASIFWAEVGAADSLTPVNQGSQKRGRFAEWPLPFAALTVTATLAGKDWIAAGLDRPVFLVALLGVLFGVILSAAMAIVRHAEALAQRLGEPAGTLLLTLAITGLEVTMIGFVMSTGAEKPTLARDAIFAVVMLVLNGFMGLALVLGSLRHGEQPYNLQGANAFLLLIVPLTVLGLVLPNYTRATPGPTLSGFQMIFLSLLSAGIYAVFLYVQNRRHRGFFMAAGEAAEAVVQQQHPPGGSTVFHAIMLGCYGLPLVLLAKQMAAPLDAVVQRFGAPPALGGFVTALLVLTPESVAGVRAALQNQLQRSVNILLGSALASIGLSIPLVIAVALLTGRSLALGLGPTDTVMLVLTLITSMLTFSLPRTSLLPGCVHLLLFGAYLMLLFDR